MPSSSLNTLDNLIDRREHADTSSLPSSRVQLQVAGHRTQSFDILATRGLKSSQKESREIGDTYKVMECEACQLRGLDPKVLEGLC